MKRNRFRKDDKIDLIKKYSIILIILIIFIVLFICLYNSNKTKSKLDIKETATTDYKVYLDDNKFYNEEYLEANKQYVENLTKNIAANYDYHLNLNNTQEFGYKYRVDAELNIYDTSTQKSLYSYTENLLPENNLTCNNGEISINEEVMVNYPYFNDIAKRFITTYALSSANASELKIKMFIKTEYMDESVVTLLVPLAKHTFDITTSNQLVSNKTAKIPEIKGNKTIRIISIISLIITFGIFALFIYKLINLFLEDRTDEEKYKSNVKKILMNYGGYINKTDDFQFNLEEYEVVRVNTFLDLLRIKEDLSRPILMIENKEKTSVIFAITDTSKYIYMYALNMYQKKLAEKNETQDSIKVGVD